MKAIRRLLALIPTKLPTGMTEFEEWSDDVLDLYNMPNNDSTKFALATSIMHLSATDAFKPKEYFGRILLKGAATQIAYAKMQEAKTRQEEKAKAEVEAAKQLEDTTIIQEVSDGHDQVVS
jgi:hypothetical protein